MKYLILGAGPAGLSFANMLKQLGETDFLVLEKESEAGGLCRSVEVDGSPFDIGGGHFLDVRRPEVTDFLFQFMPEKEWTRYSRDSRILVNGKMVNHPIEANIWQMDINDQVTYLKSIASAGCNIGNPKPERFVDWIYWKLGSRIAEDYMIPYNTKMFGSELNQLGTYWLEKLPNVSFEETLLSCLQKKAYGKQPGHAEFFYPKEYGYGEVWNRMAKAIENNVEYNKTVESINCETKTVTTTDGSIYQASIIITTIPWMEFTKISGMPVELVESIKELKFSSIQTEYYPDRLETPCHWIYYPDLSLSYHRILVRHNFCPHSKGYWTETNLDRVQKNDRKNYTYLNKYAYPLNTRNKPSVMSKLLSWTEKRGIYGLGRWGEHQHYNSDLTVELGMKLAQKLIKMNSGQSIKE